MSAGSDEGHQSDVYQLVDVLVAQRLLTEDNDTPAELFINHHTRTLPVNDTGTTLRYDETFS